jgi:hypothetical protein
VKVILLTPRRQNARARLDAHNVVRPVPSALPCQAMVGGRDKAAVKLFTSGAATLLLGAAVQGAIKSPGFLPRLATLNFGIAGLISNLSAAKIEERKNCGRAERKHLGADIRKVKKRHPRLAAILAAEPGQLGN